MKKINSIIIAIVAICFLGINSSDIMAATVSAKNVIQTKSAMPVKSPVKKNVKAKSNNVTNPVVANNNSTTQSYSYQPAKSLDLVRNPGMYLNKRVKITAKFDKFSSLGLDYKPAFRSSEKYITFLIRRDDSLNDVPLSELKNIMKREMAEKYIDLETDDVIEYSGLVFSNALGDVWLDVENFKIISSKSKNSSKNSTTKTK